MTALINYSDNPRYQRMIQKFSAIRPEQKAILDSALADEAFAGEAMRRHVNAIMTAASLKGKERSLGLQGQRLDLRRKASDLSYGLQKDKQDFAQGQNSMANWIAGANIPISGYFGAKQMQRDTNEAEESRKFRQSILAKLGV